MLSWWQLTIFTMRTLILAVALLPAVPLCAQHEPPAQVPGMPASGNVSYTDDNDPFVPNSFIGSFRMEMHLYKNGTEAREGPTTVHYWSSTDKTLLTMPGMAGKGQGMKMLTDLKGKWTYMLMQDVTGKKTGMKSRKKKIVFAGGGPDNAPQVTWTGETKLIDGHNCEKVTGTTDNGSWTAWVAKDLQANLGDLLGSIGQGRNEPSALRDLMGMALELEAVSADGNAKSLILVKDLKPGPVDEGLFSLDGYEIREMPAWGTGH